MPKDTKKFINPLLRSSQEVTSPAAPTVVPEAPVEPQVPARTEEAGIDTSMLPAEAHVEQLSPSSSSKQDMTSSLDEVIEEEQSAQRVDNTDSLAGIESGKLDAAGDVGNKASTRRRRGVKAFETTHERITLWVNKELKQDFEELAFKRNLSKTALLNEAITELLKKYGER